MTDILERLKGYNPPDRTVDGQRQTATDIHDAANEIIRLRFDLDAAKAELEISDGLLAHR